MSKKTKGNAGEDAACAYLIKKGYEIIDRNFKTEIGEIDIIAAGEGLLVFIEVKLRKNTDFGTGGEAVTYTKIKRISQVASQYMAKYRISEAQARFDVIEIYTEEGEIQHIENAFESLI